MPSILPKKTLPKYNIVLPASKQKVAVRPFTVGEEKILLLAMEETGAERANRFVDALSQIFDICTFGACQLNKMVQVDAEYLFLFLRGKSMGEGVEVYHQCRNQECNKRNLVMLNLDQITIHNSDTKPGAENIKLDDDVIITLRYPSLDATMELVDEGSNPLVSVAKCIDSITVGEETHGFEDLSIEEIVEYLEGLTQIELDTLNAYFETMPRISFDKTYSCICGTSNDIHLEGLQDFFG